MSMKRKSTIIPKHIEDQVCGNLPPLDQELDKFIQLVQSTMGFFDLRFLNVIKKNGRAYFCYGSVIAEVPLRIIEEAKKNGSL